MGGQWGGGGSAVGGDWNKTSCTLHSLLPSPFFFLASSFFLRPFSIAKCKTLLCNFPVFLLLLTLLGLQLPTFFLSCLPHPFTHHVFLDSHPLSSTTMFLKGKFQTSTSLSFFLFYLFLITFRLFSLIFLLH